MGSIPVPDRVMLNSSAGNRVSVLRAMSRVVSTDVGLHPVGIHDFLTTPDQGMIETRLMPGVSVFDGCLPGLDSPYMAVFRPVKPVMIGAGSVSPVSLMVLVLSPDKDHSGHVQRVSKIARFLKQPKMIDSLLSAKSDDEIIALFMTDHDQSRAA